MTQQNENRRIDKEQWDQQLIKLAYFEDISGMVAGVGTADQGLLYSKALGKKNMANGEEMQLDDIFHMASVTKLFVGTSVFQLWERGLCDLEEPVITYLPWLRIADPRLAQITVRQLLSHTSGMPDVRDYGWDRPETDDLALRRYLESEEVTQARLLWGPGEGRFAYSNMGYEILGALIAELSGVSFETYVEQEILNPLGMEDTTLLTFRRDLSQICAPHVKNQDKQIVLAPHYPYNRAHGPSSTLTTNLADMKKWAIAHLNFAILKESTYEIAWQEQATVPNNGEKIGLSWFRREQEGYVLYGHEGTDDGFRASFWICPELGYFSHVSANLSGAPVKKITRQLFLWYLASGSK